MFVSVQECTAQGTKRRSNSLLQPWSPRRPATGLLAPIPQILSQRFTLLSGPAPIQFPKTRKISGNRGGFDLDMTEPFLIE